jgi:hypothetical protein
MTSAGLAFLRSLWRRGAEPDVSEARPPGYDLLGPLAEDLDPALLPPTRQQVAHASLLESLRALETDLAVPTVVIAAVSGREPAREVIAGLILQAHLRGLRLTLGKLIPARGHRLLRKRIPRPPGAQLADDGIDDGFDGRHANDLTLELIGAPDIEVLRDWYERAAAGSDLLLIEAQPMLRSVDAALLGRGCGALVLVFETLGTRQEELETAIERARAAGCPPIGMVASEHREWLPRPLRKILPAYPKTVRPRR